MKSYLRFLKRNPVYTVINILGLAVSLMFVILIGDYTWRQFSMDSMHSKKGRIYCVVNHTGSFFSYPDITRAFGEQYPEIEEVCTVENNAGTVRCGERFYQDDDKPIIMMAGSSFFDMFDFKFVEGDRSGALSSPDRCVVTESLASALFGEESPLGQVVTITGRRAIRITRPGLADPYDSTLTYTVSGVVRDFDKTVLPNDTRIIISAERAPQVNGYTLTTDVYAQSSFGPMKSFVLLREDVKDLSWLTESITEHYKKHETALSYFEEQSQSAELVPLRELMFSPYNDEYSGLERGSRKLLFILLSSIICILLFAVTNYINLTAANTGMRSKEMAVRMLLGSQEREIRGKLIFESVLMVTLSFAIGLCLAFGFQDDFASLFRGRILLAKDINAGTVSVCVAFILIIGIVAGMIPAMQMSRVSPIDIVKGTFRYKSKMLFSRIFIMLQNVVTVVMLTVAAVIYLQIDHLMKAPLGYNTKNIVWVFPDEAEPAAVKDALDRMPFVKRTGTCSGSSLCNRNKSMQGCKDRNGNDTWVFTAKMDYGAFEILGLEKLEDYGYDSDALFLTETAVRKFNVDTVAHTVTYEEGRTEPLGGIVNDICQGTVLGGILPYEFKFRKTEDFDGYRFFVVETDGSSSALARLRESMEKAFDGYVSSESVIGAEEDLREQFSEERNVLHIVLIFTLIAVIISVLGFVGLSLFFIGQRRKEMALRRIMGGSISDVIMLMLAKFCAPLLASSLIAVPLAYYFADYWLRDFSYRIALRPWIFIAVCAVSILIAVASVLSQIIFAVAANPADSIKTE